MLTKTDGRFTFTRENLGSPLDLSPPICVTFAQFSSNWGDMHIAESLGRSHSVLLFEWDEGSFGLLMSHRYEHAGLIAKQYT